MSGFGIEMYGKQNIQINDGNASINRLREELREKAEAKESDGTSGVTFSDFLKSTVQEANDLQKDANHAVEELAVGKTKDIHATMIAIEKADISFRFLMQIRNKVIDAYREIMKMQVLFLGVESADSNK